MPQTNPTLIATLPVPTANLPLVVEFWAGTSILLLGANGTGKTRLGVLIENSLADKVQRIGAHRSLTMNTAVPIRSLEMALRQLRVGSENPHVQPAQRFSYKWQGNPATQLLSDFDFVVAALYAEQAQVAVAYLNASGATPRPKARLARLTEIWEQLLPHRKLVVSHGSIEVGAQGTAYDARELSDGERVLFYLLGQALLAPQGSIVVVDEPELHVNRAVLQALWDAIESERRDCCFVYVTHDLEMAASRRGAVRYALKGYRHSDGRWDIQAIPADIELPEDLVAKIVGSRVPILFVEGTLGSLDSLLYRHVYKGLTVHGAGSCEEVVRTVLSFRQHSFLHRIGCAGLIDADDRDEANVAYLHGRNIHLLPVAEIESFILLPRPFAELAKLVLRIDAAAAHARLDELKGRVFAKATANLDSTAIEATRRRIDALLKRVELSKESPEAMTESYRQGIATIDPTAMYRQRRQEIEGAIQRADYEKVLALYANKGLLAEAAAVLGQRRDVLEGLIGRLLGADDGAPLLEAVRATLPSEGELLARARG